MAFGLFDPLLTATVAIVLGCLFWRYRWRLRQLGVSQLSNAAEETLISDQNSNPADTTGLSHGFSSEEHVELDERILCKYMWATYENLPPAVQETLEPAVLKALLAMHSDVPHEACSAFLDSEPEFRALLLESWEKGSFKALRNHQKFLSLSKPAEHGNDKMSDQLSSKDPEADNSTAEPINTGETGAIPPSGRTGGEDPETTSSPSLVPGETISEGSESEEDIEHKEDEALCNQDAPETPEQHDASLHICKSTFTAGRDINVAVAVWRTGTSGVDQKIASWFFDVDYRAIHNDIAQKRSKKTGKWFLETESYEKWRTSAEHRFLFCPGIPGVGKTVMASFIVDDLRMLDESQAFVGIIYFNYKLRDKQSKQATFEGLCRQIFEIRQDSTLKTLYESHEKRKSRPTEAELRSALSTAFQHYQSCYLILDALDEYTAQYSDKEVREVISDVLSLGPNVKLFITSRILGEMKATFQELGAIREDIIGNSNDMRAYLVERVANLKSKLDFEVSEEFSQQIVEKVIEAAKGRFLVAELGMNLLAEQLNLGELEDALDKLPNEIDDTYIRVIQLIKTYPEGRRELAMKALMWIAYARRGLTVGELQHALATKPGRKETDKYVTPLSTITGLCAGLIVVQDEEWQTDPNDERPVRFVHFTTQEFFEKSQLMDFSDAHKEMFSTCIEYLTITGNHILRMGFTWASTNYLERRSYLPFYHYSAFNWGHHASTHHEPLHEEVKEFLLRNDRALDLGWEYIQLIELRHGGSIGNGGSGIFLAAYHDQISALYLLFDHMDIFPCAKRQRTPMHIAVLAGWTKVVKGLVRWSGSSWDNHLPAGTDLTILSTTRLYGDTYAFLENVPDEHGRTPLSYAAQNGEERIAELLLKHKGTEVDAKDDQGRTPLSYAIENGKDSVIKLLLEHEGATVKVDSRDNDGRTPLSYAAGNDQEPSRPVVSRSHRSVPSWLRRSYERQGPVVGPCVKLLLEREDIEVNSRDNNGRTPLSYAAETGYEGTLRLLLEHRGIEVDTVDNNGRTPFSYAAQRHTSLITGLLLEHGGIEVNSKDNNGRSPLSYAASNGRHEHQNSIVEPCTVKLLLELRGIEANLRDNSGRTPLSYAAETGHEGTLRLLLGHRGIEVDTVDNNGRTPFSYAAQRHTSLITGLLLEHGGVEVNSKDNNGRSPLSYAASNGRHEHQNSIVEPCTVKLLLELRGIEANLRDNSGRTPLSYAAETGHEGTLRLLLGHRGIEVDTVDNNGRTPFSYAAQRHTSLITGLLLEHGGVEVNSKDNNGRSPLSYAASNGRHEHQNSIVEPCTVKLLLELRGTEVNSRDNNGRTPLSYAAETGHEIIFRLILGHRGIEVDTVDNNGLTPFLYAAKGHKSSIIELLLRHGGIEVDMKDNDGRTPLSYIAQRGNYSAMEDLLEHGGVEMDSKDNTGRTPFSYAAEHRWGSLTAGSLLERGAVEVDSKDDTSRTPLSYAAHRGNESTVELLLQHGGVQVDSEDNYGRTPFSYAVERYRDSKSVMDLLEHAGAAVNSKDNTGRTPFSHAAQQGDSSTLKLMLERGDVEVDLKDNDGRTPFSYAAERYDELVIEVLLEHGGVEMNSKDDNGRTPLSHAAEQGRKSTVKLLLEHGGIEMDSKDNNGRTPFSYAAQPRPALEWWEDEVTESTINVLNLFLESGGVNVNSQDNDGRTPLSYAAEAGPWWSGRELVVELLRKHGAVDMDSEDDSDVLVQ